MPDQPAPGNRTLTATAPVLNELLSRRGHRGQEPEHHSDLATARTHPPANAVRTPKSLGAGTARTCPIRAGRPAPVRQRGGPTEQRTTLTIRIDPAVKSAAKRRAEDLGVSLSSVIANELRQFVNG
ncbi:MAG: hypothetical protein LBK95_07420, partial [Bifidobacteriaceae bacterium]|nr:hypothetical protein [Bifidobacteriaceae bacterium]